MADVTRKYELRARAEAMEATRKRIIDATIELHGTVGPARTTIASVANLAGVQRHTVYRHFPTEDGLFAACATEYWQRHPRPDVQNWEALGSLELRLSTGLSELYRFYGTVEPMLAKVLRDAETLPVAGRGLESHFAYLDTVVSTLTGARDETSGLFEAAVRHAASFRTWQSLVQQNGLETSDAVALMSTMVCQVSEGVDH